MHGQETTTDGNGGYLLRFVAIKEGESIALEAAFQRPNGRVDRAQSPAVKVVANGTTKVPEILLPDGNANRQPVILGPQKLAMDENQIEQLSFIIYDPDSDQTPQVTLSGPPFASLVGPIQSGAATPRPRGPTVRYAIRLAPGLKDAGTYTLQVEARDEAGARTTAQIELLVRNVNRLPVVMNQSLTIDEDRRTEIVLAVTDPDDDPLTFHIVNNPLHGALSGTGTIITYTPARDFSGADLFAYRINDGTADSNTATVSITVRPVNDAPVVTVPAAQSVREGQTLRFAVGAFDVDQGQTLSFTPLSLPAGVTLETLTATSAQFSWTPNFTQAGDYVFGFKVTDNGSPPLSVAREIAVTVYDARHDFAIEDGDLTVFGADANSGLADATGADVATGDVNGDASRYLVMSAPFARARPRQRARLCLFWSSGAGRRDRSRRRRS